MEMINPVWLCGVLGACRTLFEKVGSRSHYLTVMLFLFLSVSLFIAITQTVTEVGVSNQLLSIIIGLIVLMLGWLFHLARGAHTRISEYKDKQNDARIDIIKELSEHARRTEVENLVQKTVAPIREDVKEIKADVKWLIRRANGIDD
jgi:hypothetical protein